MKTDKFNLNTDHRIAVIGMACRFPGAKNINEYWHNLIYGKNSISFFSKEQLAELHIDQKLLNDPNYVAARGVLDDIYCFDAEFFGFSPYEAKIIDPQQRIFFELAWSALEDAGYAGAQTSYLIGVYAGMSDSSYLQHNLYGNKHFLETADHYQLGILTSGSFLSSRTSYLLNLKGPSININTACSTSLVTVVAACKDLIYGDCDIAVAGGVSIHIPQEEGYLYREGAVFSSDGQCKTFDAKANGIVLSSGAGVVVLKRLSDALRDNDNIYAVLLGYAINNDGADKVGYTAPSIAGQINCIINALSMAHISPEEINYVEAHGTGTPLGDPIEVAALTKAFQLYTSAQSYCAIGSVKTNIGHTDVASGIAGFIKTVLSIKYGIIPPSLHFNTPNPKINFKESPFFVNTTLRDWPKNDNLRRAAVNSLGMGGTNAHVILEQALSYENNSSKDRYYLLPYSAKTDMALANVKENLRNFLQESNQQYSNKLDIKNVAYTLQQKRMHFDYRAFMVTNNTEFATQSLDIESAKFNVNEPANKSNLLCFMFSGQGAQYLFMGKALYDNFSIFTQCVDTCAEKLSHYLNYDLKALLFPTSADQLAAAEKLQQTQYAQPATFVIEYSVAKLLESFAIYPDVIIGHSIGEYTAAHLAGVFSLDEALRLIAMRAKIVARLRKGSMLAVSLGVEEIKKILPKELSIAAINASDLCVVSGEEIFIENFIKDLNKYNAHINTQRLCVSHAFHSHMMDDALEQFQKELAITNFNPSKMSIVSTLTGRKLSSLDMSSADYWLKHFRDTVLFSDAIEESYNLGCRLYLEIGPGNILTRLIKRQKKRQEQIFAFNTLPHVKDFTNDEKNTDKQFLTSIGKLWQHGIKVNWQSFWQDEIGKTISLPTYPFTKTENVILSDKYTNLSKPQCLSNNKTLAYFKPIWVTDSLPMANEPADQNIWLIFSDDLGFGAILKDLLIQRNQIVIFVSKEENYSQKSQYEYRINPIKKEDFQQLFAALALLKSWPKYVVHLFSLSSFEFSNQQSINEEFQANGYYSLINFSQIFLSKNYLPPKILIVSNKVKKIFHYDEIIPEKATILGPCLIIPQEYIAAEIKFIDVDYSKELIEIYAKLFITETITKISPLSHDTIVGYRNGQRFIHSYHEIPYHLNNEASLQTCSKIKTAAYKTKEIIFNDNSIYLITGGIGQLGLNIAKMIAKQAHVKLVLLDRSWLPAKNQWDELLHRNESDDKIILQIKAIKEIEKSGSEVYVYSLDIGQEAECQRIMQEIQKKIGLVNGVIHAAGITGNAALSPINELNEAFIKSQFSAKMYGLINIIHTLDLKKLDFCVLFSSLASFMGGIGYATYSAANQYLDAFANQQNNNFIKPFITSINWDTWNLQPSLGYGLKSVVNLDSGLKALEFILREKLATEVIVSNSDWLWRMNALYQASTDSNLPPKDENKNQEVQYHNSQNKELSEIENQVASIFQQCLGIENIGFDDDFYNVGGHSLLAVRLMVMLGQEFGLKIALSELDRARTVRNLAALIYKNNRAILSPFVELKGGYDSVPPLFLFHPINGSVSCYFDLAKNLNYEGQVIGIQDIALEQKNSFSTFEEMASFYLANIRKRQTTGPYKLAGASLGGNLAYEVTKQLSDAGEEISFLGLFDSWALFSAQLKDKIHFKKIMRERLSFLEKEIGEKSIGFDEFLNLIWHRMELLCSYQPKPINTKVILFKALDLQPEYQEINDFLNHWESYVNQIDLELIPGDHDSILKSPNLEILVKKIDQYIIRGQ